MNIFDIFRYLYIQYRFNNVYNNYIIIIMH